MCKWLPSIWTIISRSRRPSLFSWMARCVNTSTSVWTGWSQCTRRSSTVFWPTRWAWARPFRPSLCLLTWPVRKVTHSVRLVAPPPMNTNIRRVLCSFVQEITQSCFAVNLVHAGNWGPHLIIVPTSVMLNWEMELKRWCPGFKILTYFGSQKERKMKRQVRNTCMQLNHKTHNMLDREEYSFSSHLDGLFFRLRDGPSLMRSTCALRPTSWFFRITRLSDASPGAT